jgi:hypothetical protein
MRKGIALLLLAALVGVIGVNSADAKRSNKALAVVAVKEAVQEQYPQFNTIPAYVNVTQAHVPVSCKGLSRSKFKCLWSARNNLHERASGGARVTVYRHGGDARLYNVKCEKPYGSC